MLSSFNFGRIGPSFMIIGVQKAGTSSLHQYLVQHPELVAPMPKELHYFDTKNPTSPKEYLELFPKGYFSRNKSFEATPRYLYYPGTAKKICDFSPKMKFIVLLRDPVKRAYSAWNMYREMASDSYRIELFKAQEEKNPTDRIYSYFYKNEFPSFEEWVFTELEKEVPKSFIEPSIVRRGYYKEQIDEYFKYFDRKQFLFIDFKELKENTVPILNRVSSYLNISNFNDLTLDLEIQNKRAYKDSITPETYTFLLAHFQEKNRGLETLADLDLDWMNN